MQHCESTVTLVQFLNTRKELYGTLPALLQVQFKTMYLHPCMQWLRTDLVSLVTSTTSCDDEDEDDDNNVMETWVAAEYMHTDRKIGTATSTVNDSHLAYISINLEADCCNKERNMHLTSQSNGENPMVIFKLFGYQCPFL